MTIRMKREGKLGYNVSTEDLCFQPCRETPKNISRGNLAIGEGLTGRLKVSEGEER